MRLLGAAETALWTCRRTAGSRILAKCPRAEKSALGTVPKTQLYAYLGADRLRTLNGDERLADPEWLIVGGTEAFEMMLENWGYAPERVTALGKIVAAHSANTLHQAEPDALPPVILNV